MAYLCSSKSSSSREKIDILTSARFFFCRFSHQNNIETNIMFKALFWGINNATRSFHETIKNQAQIEILLGKGAG